MTFAKSTEHFNYKHGYTERGKVAPEFWVWHGMIQRCENSKSVAYHLYGGRGIAVCKAWRESFVTFLQDMGRRPEKGFSLERVDNAKGYEPGNVIWASMKVQLRNTRRTHFLTFNGKTQCLRDWAYEVGLTKETLAARVRMGWPVEKALTTPSAGKPSRMLSFMGKTQTLNAWAREFGLRRTTLRARLAAGLDMQRALLPVSR